MDPIKEYINKNKKKFLNELDEFIRFKSISTDKNYSEEMKKCRDYVIKSLQAIGAKASPLETHGIDAVYGELCCHEKAKTVLIYGHYDVQPAHKDDGWESEPFKIEKKDGRFFARGTADDKGPVLAVIKAIETLQNTSKIKLNFKFLIEGEEESGSSLGECIKENKSRLKSDLVFVSDTEWLTKDTPAIPYSLRGIVYAFIRVNGTNVDVHSGTYGGMLKNPHLELARILTQLKDENEKVLIPNFYDKVKTISDSEKKLMSEIPFDIKHVEQELGTELTSKNKVELFIKQGAMPTFEVHGITGGYTGNGAKTIIPAYAEAKVSMRLVHEQNPKEIFDSFVKKVKSINSKAIVTLGSMDEPFLIDYKNEYLQKASKVMEKVFDKKPAFTREGASIPVTVTLKRELNIPVVLFGIGNYDCHIHSPKENLSEEHFYLGIEAIAKYFVEISE